MTLLSIFCPKLRFRESKASSVGGPKPVTHWFLDAADQIATLISSSKCKNSPEESAVGRLLSRPKCECKKCEADIGAKGQTSPDLKRDPSAQKHDDKHTVESFKFKAMNIRESGSVQKGSLPTKFRVGLIQEGLGNFGDAFYYSGSAIESGVAIFEGLKVYADHPTAEEDEIRPERTTRDIIGHYENCAVEESDKGGQKLLCADLIAVDGVNTEWARALMVRSVENAKKFPDKPFVGLSINASGDSDEMEIDKVMQTAPEGAKAKLEEAKANGIESVKVVNKINAAKSCDLVTEAGAGGKILNLIEGERTDGKTKGKESQRKSGGKRS